MVEHLQKMFEQFTDLKIQDDVKDKAEHDAIIASDGVIIRLFVNDDDPCPVYTGQPTWNVYNAEDSRIGCRYTLESIVRNVLRGK